MAAGAAYYFNMLGFNKQDITPDFAANHVSYILNRNKVGAVGSQHAPTDYYAAQDWLTRHVHTGRRNARVWTRFILNLPYDLTHEQRVRLVRDYLARLSDGRAPFLWAIHTDTRAPHAHVVFVDKDVSTGKRVAQLSEKGSAYRWRKVWEECCNRALTVAGSMARVSRWGKHSMHHAQLNEAARKEREQAASLSGTALSPPEATPKPLPPSATIRPQAGESQDRDVDLQEDRGPSLSEQDNMMEPIVARETPAPSLAAVVAFVSSQVIELQRLRAARQTVADYRAQYAQVSATLFKTQARMDIVDADLQRAGARVIKAEQEAARHKGIVQRLWQLVSPAARAQAKAAQTASQMALYSLSSTRIKATTLLQEAQALQAEQTALREKANALKASLAIYGSEDDLDEAEKVLMRTIKVNSAELTSVELSQALLAGKITADEHRHLMLAIDRGGHDI